MTNGLPPGYPFPDDRLLYCTARDDFDPYRHSYTAIAELPEGHEVVVNDARHRNSHRLTIHTPIRGPTSFLTKPLDAEGLVAAALRLAMESGSVFGPEDEIRINKTWIRQKLGGEIETIEGTGGR